MPMIAAIAAATVVTVAVGAASSAVQKDQAKETIDNQQNATLMGAKLSVTQPYAEAVSALA